MFQLEKEIYMWKKALNRSRELEEADICELESHVRDEIRQSIANGLGEEAAFRAATQGSDNAGALVIEYAKGRSAGPLAWSCLKTSFRKMRKQKAYSFINIVGLALGLACSILILFWVRDELGFNMFHEKADRLSRVNKAYQIGAKTEVNNSTPFPLARALRESVPEIEDATGFYRLAGLINRGDKSFFERRMCVADTSFFRMFTFPFVKGDPATALGRPGSAVITESFAAKYFIGSEAVGRILTYDQTTDLLITGVIKDIPSNSDIQFDLFAAAPGLTAADAGENWGSHYVSTYVLLKPGADAAAAEVKLSNLIQARLPEEKISLRLQPLGQLHLYTADGREEGMKYVYFFSVIAVFILIIACINYVNLSTARSEKRAKEVGLRKVVGASRSQIARQFFGESAIVTLVALALALIIIRLLQGPFNSLTGKTLRFSEVDSGFFLSLLPVIAFAALASGLYPALVLSSFKPIQTFRNVVRRPGRKAPLRKALVVLQFSLTIILLIGTMVIYRQLRFVQDSDLGFDQKNVVYLGLNDKVRESYDAFRTEMMSLPEVAGVARMSELPMEIWSITRGVTWEGKDTPGGAAFGYAVVDHDTLDLMGMTFAAGRNFSRDFPADKDNFIFNEKAIALMGMKDPVGKPFSLGRDSKGVIVGVVKDFHSLPLTYAIEPMVIRMNPNACRLVLVKLRPGAGKTGLARMEAVWRKMAPGYPFEFRFVDDRFGLNYAQEVRAGKVFGYFVAVAVFISCLGLLGLASFTAEQRTKEIGIRKTLGASTAGIVGLLTKQFLRWVVLANIFAWPVAYFAVRGWLNHFAYRTRIGLPVFILAGAAALLIALLTVSVQAVLAARAEPVDSLKYE